MSVCCTQRRTYISLHVHTLVSAVFFSIQMSFMFTMCQTGPVSKTAGGFKHEIIAREIGNVSLQSHINYMCLVYQFHI